jgi:hypothetical protein
MKEPVTPTLTPSAADTPVPKPDTPVEIGKPVKFAATPLEGVPSAPPFVRMEPAVPVLTPSADNTPVPVVAPETALPADT